MSVPAAVTVVVCDGHRCRGLRGRTDTGAAEGTPPTLLEALRDRVRRSRYAVLIRSDCLGACARAPAALVIRRTSPQAEGGTGVLFGPLETAEQVHALLDTVLLLFLPSPAVLAFTAWVPEQLYPCA